MIDGFLKIHEVELYLGNARRDALGRPKRAFLIIASLVIFAKYAILRVRWEEVYALNVVFMGHKPDVWRTLTAPALLHEPPTGQIIINDTFGVARTRPDKFPPKVARKDATWPIYEHGFMHEIFCLVGDSRWQCIPNLVPEAQVQVIRFVPRQES